ncbi:Gfo/Idh/MocA family protein [Telluribacter humicola]|uniref:Gfo/Idh/MocA family protein n=1 Tax=Telluribacter humicola TaxID=1720261 RepID=UPI001A962E17|nr:Gfo/Idh/MocA family oxidoreductase [Telluribacter humicola]
MKRRSFIQKTALTALGTGLFSIPPNPIIKQLRKRVAPSDKLQLGVIGCNGMGRNDLLSHLKMSEVECVALADVDQNVLYRQALDVEKIQGSCPALYKDYRELLDNQDVDAVIIGTPDHWHCLTLTDALSAGKHVYCEKPLANSIEECTIMLSAARRYNKMIQIGQWQRSGSHYEEAIDYIRSQKLGNIRLVKVWSYQGWMPPVPIKPDCAPPAGVDYDMWLGPAPRRDFNPNRFHFNFRWFWDYAGGLMTDWGVHEIDIALYAMNAKVPKSVMASGGKLAYPDDASETPDTLQALFEYDGFNMLWEHATGIDGGNYGKTEGIAFIGNNATLVLNRDGWEVHPETETKNGVTSDRVAEMPVQGRQGDYLSAHTRGFVQAIKNNNPALLKCGIETGSIAAINAHMGNIAFKTGRKIYWDEARGRFKNDAEANALIKANYRKGWKLPVV